MNEHLYKPGDIIERTGPGLKFQLRVMDPPRTKRGKLRLWSSRTLTERTTWWGYRGDTFLPPNYRYIPVCATLVCPECGESIWDLPRGSKLAKCWNVEGHADGRTLAFDTMNEGDDNEA